MERRLKIKTYNGSERNAARNAFVLRCKQWNVKQAGTEFTCNFNQTAASSSPNFDIIIGYSKRCDFAHNLQDNGVQTI